MTRRRRALAAPALALCAALALSGEARVGAQAAPPAQNTALESDALQQYRQNHLLTARTRAQAVLDRDPDSIVGNYVMGCVLREAEGSLPRAMYHLGRARQVYEQRYGTQYVQGAPWQLHRDVLYAAQTLAGEMEEYDYQLQILEFHDALYDPDLLAEHAWPLLHLGRFDEARAYARRAIGSNDPWQATLGRNALCAIEGEAHQRQAEFGACLDAFADTRRRAESDPPNPTNDPTVGTPVATSADNAAHAAYGVLRFDEVERLARLGTRRIEYTTANPWRTLARLYTDEGRAGEAVAAAREMQQWRMREPASLRDQDRAETDVALATLLLVAGEESSALALVDRAIERPDRRGLVSSRPEQALGAHALLRRVIARALAERTAERASASGSLPRARGIAAALGQRTRAWPDDERVVSVLADEERLDATLRVYVSGGLEPVPVWLLGELVHVLGAGVVAVALEDARSEERATPGLTAYYDGLEAEVALAQGDDSRAVRLAQRALGALPQAEALLQARVAAVGAEAARRDGNTLAMLSLFERAMQRDPGVLRRLGLALPVVLRVAGGDEAVERAGELLRRSPRVAESERGFALSVERAGSVLRACLRTAQGTTLSCTEITPARGEAPRDAAARLCDAFHESAFATRGGLSSTDLRSLDGSTTVAHDAQRQQMQNVLNELANDPDAQQ